MLMWLVTWFLMVLIIIIHETGHALAAKFLKVPIQNVNIGISKNIFKFTGTNGTVWNFNLLPIGGAILINDNVLKNFQSKFLVIISGSLMNLVIAWMMLIISQMSIISGTQQFLNWLELGLIFIFKLLTLQLHWPELSGPFTWFEFLQKTIAEGLGAILSLIAALNIILGLTNLLPLPGLDGCEMIYAIIEKIRCRPVSIALQRLLMELFWIGFVVFIAQVTIHDAMLHGYLAML